MSANGCHEPGLTSSTTRLAYTRRGAGAPLVLLHALGSSRAAWNPVLPALAEHFDVVAVDLPGFGQSPPLPADIEASPQALARSVVELLDDIGITLANLVGNSLGGWVALELAQLRPASSITLLAPAGLWRNHTPLYCLVSLRTTHWLCRHAPGPLRRLVTARLGRILVLGLVLGRPARLTVEAAQAAVTALGTAPGFDRTLQATVRRRYKARTPLNAPVTVAFGSRDHILLNHQSRDLAELPPGTRTAMLPGCGHLPMSDDPQAVVNLIRSVAADDAQKQRTTSCLNHDYIDAGNAGLGAAPSRPGVSDPGCRWPSLP